MSSSNNEHSEVIYPLMIKLDNKIEADVFMLKLPSAVKEKLIRLEENSNKKFIREKHSIPLNSLKKLFIIYLPGVSDMKAVSNYSDDSRWLVACEKINVSNVVKIIKQWIDAFYIEESELEKKRNNSVQVKDYARQVIDEINEELFSDCLREERLILFDNGEVFDKDAYSLLPLIAVSKLVGTKVCIHDHKTTWMFCGKKEIVTDPLDLDSSDGFDKFSYVLYFSVQTIPPNNEPYLNIDISSRRWISHNDEHIVPYLGKDKKSIYIRVSNEKLQVMQVKYQQWMDGEQGKEEKGEIKPVKIDWLYADKKCYQLCYGNSRELHSFEDIIKNPSEYMNGTDYIDAYIPFEYGLEKKQVKIEHNQKAGKSFDDCKQLFDDVLSKTNFTKSNEYVFAEKISGNQNSKVYFEDDFFMNNPSEFADALSKALDGRKLNVEIWFSGGQEDIKDELSRYLLNHLSDANYELHVNDLEDTSDCLECENEKLKLNLAGFNTRLEKIVNYIDKTEEPTIAFVVLHNEKYFKLDGKIDARVDPKNAIRIGFARTGRLTQFITPENFKEKQSKIKYAVELYNRLKMEFEQGKREKEPRNISKNNKCNMVIRNAILDGYRQLGIMNNFAKKLSLSEKTITGIYVCNYKNIINGTRIQPFAMFISCDMISKQINVNTELQIVDANSYKRDGVIAIDCPYWQFPIKLIDVLYNLPRGKTLKGTTASVDKWFARIDQERKNEIVIIADGTSRKLVPGIANSEIAKHYDDKTINTYELVLDAKSNEMIDLKKYDNLSFVRIRINNEVPDYIPFKQVKNYKNTSGVYSYQKIYYSQDVRTKFDDSTFNEDKSKTEDDSAFTHRNIIEIYPLYSSEDDRDECACDIHNLRKASIQYEAQKTVLPLPLHLAKLLEEYII